MPSFENHLNLPFEFATRDEHMPKQVQDSRVGLQSHDMLPTSRLQYKLQSLEESSLYCLQSTVLLTLILTWHHPLYPDEHI